MLPEDKGEKLERYKCQVMGYEKPGVWNYYWMEPVEDRGYPCWQIDFKSPCKPEDLTPEEKLNLALQVPPDGPVYEFEIPRK
jgi:hypothetical protein